MNNSINKWRIGSGHNENRLKIAVANMKVAENNINSSILSNPNVCISRQYELWKLLNHVECESGYTKENKCHLLVLPEVSIPHQWLPKLVHYCRDHQLGIVVGLEHISVKNTVYNFIVTILPFLENDTYKNVFVRTRLKNYYSPGEIHLIVNQTLNGNDLHIPNKNTSVLDIFEWKGVLFSVLNCFEATDISFRSDLKGLVDLVVISEYNPDVEYFSNIAESSARDLHAFVIQVNSSDFGDTRIIQPSKSIHKDIVKVKGGDNSTILTAHIDIQKLRQFQSLKYPLQKEDESFKPTPANFKRQYF